MYGDYLDTEKFENGDFVWNMNLYINCGFFKENFFQLPLA